MDCSVNISVWIHSYNMVVIPHLCCNLILQHKIWLKPSAEQQFVYGHHVMKSGLGRITENTSQYEGVVVYSMNDLPLVWMHLLLKENLFFPKCLLFFIKKEVSSWSHIWINNTCMFAGFWSGSQIHTRLSPCRPYDLGGLSSSWHRRIHQEWRGFVIDNIQHGLIFTKLLLCIIDIYM